MTPATAKKTKKATPTPLTVAEHGKAITKALKVIGNDGHTIYAPTVLLKAGLPPEWVDALTHVYKSDRSSPKSTIFVDGKPVKDLSGVYGLDVLWRIAHEIDADTKAAGEKMGRGFQAVELTTAIKAKLKEG